MARLRAGLTLLGLATLLVAGSVASARPGTAQRSSTPRQLRVQLLTRDSAELARLHGVRVRVTARVQVKARLLVRVAPHGLLVAQRWIHLPGARTKIFRLPLTRAARRQLTACQKVSLSLTGSAYLAHARKATRVSAAVAKLRCPQPAPSAPTNSGAGGSSTSASPPASSSNPPADPPSDPTPPSPPTVPTPDPPPAPTPGPPGPTAPAPPEPTGAPIADEGYVNPAQLTGLPFGVRSHWDQPWRAYSDTMPATMLQDAVGVNFDVRAEEADATARMLAANGFRRARVEVQWDTMSYSDPSTFADDSVLRAKLTALHKYGIRPLILLNANQMDPTPYKAFTAHLTQPAAAGATHVQLDAATAAQVVPGRSGLNSFTGYPTAARFIFTSVDSSNVATLSQPLSQSLAAGNYPATTLRFQPFGQPQLANGSPNPRFDATMAGWLQFVSAVTHDAKSILGSEAFDVEVWNEVSFGSDFLYIENYYSPAPAESGDTFNAILSRTVSWVRDPANGVSDIGVGDGFANQRPWDSGANTPAGLSAIDRHPYFNMKSFPSQAVFTGLQPLNALGNVDGYQDSSGRWHDNFIPSYSAYFPEYFLSGIQTETMVRDISPITTYVGDTPHGRYTHQTGAAPPGLWITEYNLDPAGAISSAADITHMRAKMALRELSAYVNKGVSAIDFYAAKDPNYNLVSSSFYDAIPSGYPGDSAGGSIVDSIRRYASSLSGATSISTPRQVSLTDIGDFNGKVQFSGDGTAAHPPLYDRDVLAFFPFQVDAHRFVIPTYVMTRNLAKVYNTSAPSSDPTRFDMPPQWFRLTINGVDGTHATLSATDPLTGDSVSVTKVAGTTTSVTVDMPLTDSPRMLTVDDAS